MKKIIMYIAAIFLVITLTACIRSWSPPYGIWQSAEPNITLFIEREIREMHSELGSVFTGLYVRGDEEINIIIVFEGKGGHISIYENAILDDRSSWRDFLLFGSYHIEGENLYIESSTYDTIVFSLIEEAAADSR